jgi:hypothetical protein
MSQPESPDQGLAAKMLTLRIIIGALVAGAVTFLVIAFVMRGVGLYAGSQTKPVLTYTGIGLGVVMLLAHIFVPHRMVTAGRQRLAQRTEPAGPADEVNLLWGLYQNQTIVAAALLESAAFFLIIAYLLEGDPWSLPLWPLLLIAGMAMLFPTQLGVDNWIKEQRQRLRQERPTVR